MIKFSDFSGHLDIPQLYFLSMTKSNFPRSGLVSRKIPLDEI